MSDLVPRSVLLVGFGATNQAVAAALVGRGHSVTATDDRPGTALTEAAGRLGLDLVEAPDTTELSRLVGASGLVVPGPGLPDHHPVFALAADHGVGVATELDLAAAWDDRPVAAVTGTNGKTTVTTMVAAMLRAGGTRCVEAGNNELPLVAAIDDPGPEWFVVEASSFRLARATGWAPRVATWLNWAPDHLDVHASLAAYEQAKARIWAWQRPGDVAVGNRDDPVVARHLDEAPARRIGFSLSEPATYHLVRRGPGPARLAGPGGDVVDVAALPRHLDHDLANALAAAATAEATGCPRDAVVGVLASFSPLPHRVQRVASVGGVDFYDDSKATVPSATLAAVGGFESVVLIAGGRNKGLDLAPLAQLSSRLRAVVAIGESAGEVAAVFDGVVPVRTAMSMGGAVTAAHELARPGDAVLLSPACASFDWYPDYAARGDDFAHWARTIEEEHP